MISFAQPLPIGNAVRLILAPPAGSVSWRLLRKTADSFVDEEDPDAALLYEGAETSVLDRYSLTNGTPYYYRLYSIDSDDVWSASATVTVTPLSEHETGGPDVLSLVRERIELSLRAAVAALKIKHEAGYVPCLTAPPLYKDTRWPVVTVHLRSDSNDVEGLAQQVTPGEFDVGDGEWTTSEGWLSRIQLQIIAWSLNPDQRITLRNLIKAAIVGNLQVFDDAGMVQMQLSFSDTEDTESYDAPVYQSVVTFSCLAPFVVSATVGAVLDVDSSITSTEEGS